ncbi:uncharacterized protein [Procambarus clarkii]|uniref:uncharacterized protein n=1 Tax=Procambarus clarkii TaxID=6728 RepID=UPI003741F6C7
MRANAVYVRRRQERQPLSVLSFLPSDSESVTCNEMSSCQTTFLESRSDWENDTQQQSACKVPRLEKNATKSEQTKEAATETTAPARPTMVIFQEVFNIIRNKLTTPKTQLPTSLSQPTAPMPIPLRKMFLFGQDGKKLPVHDDASADKENIPPVASNIPTAVSMLGTFRQEARLKQNRQFLSSPLELRCLTHTHGENQPFPGILKPRHKTLSQKDDSAECVRIISHNHSHKNVFKEGTPITSSNEKRKPIYRRSRRDDNTPGNVLVSRKHLNCFFQLVEDPVVRKFLKTDICRRYADKYLLAMVFTYFVRADLKSHQYSRKNFFAALYLAHDMEEDEEELKYEVLPWTLGHAWRKTYTSLLRIRDDIFWAIGCRAVVSKRCCDQVMGMQPDHWLWERERPVYHGGAHREYLKHPDDNGHPRGPDKSPLQCRKCLERECRNSESSYLLYLSESETSTDSLCVDGGKTVVHKERDSGFETFLCPPSDTSINSPPPVSMNCDKMDTRIDILNDTKHHNGNMKLTHFSYTEGSITQTHTSSESSPYDVLENDYLELPGKKPIEILEEVASSQADTIFTSQIQLPSPLL